MWNALSLVQDLNSCCVSISYDDNDYTTGTSNKKVVLDTSLFNTQHYKVLLKGKVEQSRERISALPYKSM